MGFEAKRMLMQRPELSKKAFDHKIAKIVCSLFLFVLFFVKHIFAQEYCSECPIP